MRILVISNYYPPLEIGGWEQLTENVVERLRQRGHEVLVLTSNHRFDNQEIQEDPYIRRILHLESPDYVQYHPWYTFTQTRREGDNRRELVHTIIQFAPDIVFVNGMWNLPHSLARTAEILLPDRVVYYVASYWPIEPSAHIAYWTDTPQILWKRWSKMWLGLAVRRLFIPSTPRNQLHFPLVLCVSRYMQDILVREAEIPLERTRVVYNGIDMNNFPQVAVQTNISKLCLLYAGRLSPDKGVHTVIESLSHLDMSQLSMPVTLSILGGGTDAYVTELRDLAAKLGVANLVNFFGRVPREEMPSMLATHQVLLFSSIWPEPLARMVQEGMASGLVVIGTTTGGTPEILRDGETGITFPAEDAKTLAEKIALIASDTPLRERLVQNARQAVREQFTLERMVDELEYYFSIMDKTAIRQKA